ncbi:MAG TPA: hypothetical protein VGO58_00795, partial [Chitinophagaceae bacterium]|nr:hypothetical protein [Chitinophagaceae bacterium]
MRQYLGWPAISKRTIAGIYLLAILTIPAFCYGNKLTDSTKKETAKTVNIAEHLLVFYPLQPDAGYTVTICADLPDNNDPKRVYKKKEPGHVFL